MTRKYFSKEFLWKDKILDRTEWNDEECDRLLQLFTEGLEPEDASDFIKKHSHYHETDEGVYLTGLRLPEGMKISHVTFYQTDLDEYDWISAEHEEGFIGAETEDFLYPVNEATQGQRIYLHTFMHTIGIHSEIYLTARFSRMPETYKLFEVELSGDKKILLAESTDNEDLYKDYIASYLSCESDTCDFTASTHMFD